MEARIFLLGLDGAGKTTLLYRLKGNETPVTQPTLGLHVETIEPINNITFTTWDVSGQDWVRLHSIRRLFGADIDGLVFVVDSADSSRFREARWDLVTPTLAWVEGVPLVLLANKQDLPGAWPPMQVAEEIGLSERPGNWWHVQGCCAAEAMTKLSEMVKQYRRARGYVFS